MLVPTLPAQPLVGLAPVGIASSSVPPLPPTGGDATTSLSVRRATLNVLADHAVTVAGSLLADDPAAGPAGRMGLPGRMVFLQAYGRGGWKTLARVLTAASGAYRLRFTPRRAGSKLLRLRFSGDARDVGAHRRVGRLNVYRLTEASWYGGGGSMACGGELTSSTLGVANKTLPCGTLVTLRYDGRSIRVPVVDRGPYVVGREFDLTEATRRALGFGETGEVWSTR